jgi:glucose/mannose transport system substrate-binding protein
MFIMDRAKWMVSLALIILTFAAAGCRPVAAPQLQAAEETQEPTAAAAASPTDIPTDTLEVLSWSDPSSGDRRLQALIGVFRQLRQDVDVTPIFAGAEYRGMLAKRTVAGELPDTWQVLTGYDVLGEAMSDQQRSAPLTELYSTEGWTEVMPEDMLALVGSEGSYYQVPVRVRRGNVLWHNENVLAAAGLDASALTSVDAFLDTFEPLKELGVDPLCIADAEGSQLAQLFENVAVSALGQEKYAKLWSGGLDTQDPGVAAAVSIFGRLLSDRGAHVDQSLPAAIDRFIAEQCAFLAAPDWVYSQLVGAGMQEEIDFGWMAFPGAEGTFLLLADGFSLSQDNTSSSGLDWLRAVGSKEGQEAFAADGYSVCARTDCSEETFNAYQQWVKKGYEEEALTPSFVYGASALPEPSSLQESVMRFSMDLDESSFIAGLDEAMCPTCIVLCDIVTLWFC